MAFALVLGLVSQPDPARAENVSDEQRADALAISQAVVGKTLDDFTFADSRGKNVRLSDFRGKPLALNFIYTGCAHSCGVMTAMLADTYETAWEALGEDSFNAVTIGFDTPQDTPQRMRTYARERSVDGIPRWHFLSADAATIAAVTKAAGFIFEPSPKGFDHLDQITLIDADGTVRVQVYGELFDKPLLIDPIKSLVFGTATPFVSIEDLVKKVRLFCTIYDPKTDRYRFDISIFLQMGAGILVIGTVIVILIREVFGPNRRRRRRQDRSSLSSSPSH